MREQALRTVFLTLTIVAAAPGAMAADLYACKLSDDRRSVSVLVSNPYPQETSCTVNCHLRIPGGMVSVSCTKTVPGDARDFVLCTRSRDNAAAFGNFDSGNGECVKPLAQKKDDDDEDDEELIKRLQRQGQEMLEKMQKNK